MSQDSRCRIEANVVDRPEQPSASMILHSQAQEPSTNTGAIVSSSIGASVVVVVFVVRDPCCLCLVLLLLEILKLYYNRMDNKLRNKSQLKQ